MSAKLSMHYDQLTARERLPLIMAAAARGDAVEKQRLIASAPRLTLTVPHHFGLAQALNEAASGHLHILLVLAAEFWQAWGRCGWLTLSEAMVRPRRRKTRKRRAKAEYSADVQLYCRMRYQAYLFVTDVDGWKQFCNEWSVDPEALLNFMPGWDLIIETQAEARAQAFSHEDVVMHLLNEAMGPDDAPLPEGLDLTALVTVEGLAMQWHRILEEAEATEGGG
jgi:hypothetical protein